MKLQPDVKRFERVRKGLTDAILDGTFRPGDRLPSLRKLCSHFGVSLATVQRAVQELKEEEWLISNPCKGISVADPLPPMAYLMHVRTKSRSDATLIHQAAHDSVGTGRNGTLRCLVYDEILLPLFEWAAAEYADSYAPLSLRFEFQPLPGHDDEESMRNLDADLALLPSYAVGRAARLGTITPSAGMLPDIETRFTQVSPGVMEMVSYENEIWAVPLMAGGALLMARDEHCHRFGIDPTALASMEDLVTAMETATASSDPPPDLRLFNITGPMTLFLMAGHTFPELRRVPEALKDAAVRSLLERLRALRQHPSVDQTRFDQWAFVDLSRLAIRHQPSGIFCHDPANREGSRILPIPPPETGGAVIVAHCLTISARSLHPFEAWEWAAHLAEAPFQRRLATLGYEIPANLDPKVTEAFGRTVGDENAHTLQDLIRNPSHIYGVGPDDIMDYVWEVLGNETYRFVAGMNSYDRMLERVTTKTQRYIDRTEANNCWRSRNHGL